MTYGIFQGTKRINKQRYTNYEAARSAARKFLRELGFTSRYHNPALRDFDLYVRPL